ncbi:MAG: PDZ domain-containing protein [Planctomycetes bacterium]|nr:PDZ domain-containing protein [Planctomycetota bacterium]
MEENKKSNVEIEEGARDSNSNLITVLITLIVLVVVAVIYWDRQNQRNFQQSWEARQIDLMDEFGQRSQQQVNATLPAPQLSQQVNAAISAKPVAFSRPVSYKNIVAMVAPAVVSVNVGSSFINQGPVVQSQPVGFGMGNGLGRGNGLAGTGILFCPQCNIAVPGQAQSNGSAIYCPKCGICMLRGVVPGADTTPMQKQVAQVQNQPADQSLGFPGFGQYIWGGRMGGWAAGPGGSLLCPNCNMQVPHQTGIPAYTINCPSCGTKMIRQGTASTPPGQQVAAPIKDNQFNALGKGGSGVIVNSRGYVLTNHHVIHRARSITVTLSIGNISKTYPAELIDEAPALDFAIIRIIANGEVFTPVKIGVSSDMSVGDEVLAMGSPFGLQQTVTSGIISNTRRTLTVGNKTFTNFIQTDAPINPGSSGGPLINVNGELIGITTAIYSPTQAFSGIGFASPIDPAKAVFPEFIDVTSNAAVAFRRKVPNWARGPVLRAAAQGQQGQGLNPWYPPRGQTQQMANTAIQRGQGLYPWCPPGGRTQQMANTTVARPRLGIRVCSVDQTNRAFLGLPMGYGVLVTEIYSNSPCIAAGLHRGDVIFRADNRSIKDGAMLENLLCQKRLGEKLKLTVYRDGKKISLPVNLLASSWPGPGGTTLQAQPVALPTQPTPGAATPPALTGAMKGAEVGAGEVEGLGMEIVELTPILATTAGVPNGVKGLIIVESTAQAAASGFAVNDVIVTVNGQRIVILDDFVNVMNKASLTNGIPMVVYRQGRQVNLTLKN